MKKLIFTLLFLTGTLMNYGQITIVNSDFAGEGILIIQANDTTPGPNIVPGDAGADKTWDFSSLTPHTFDSIYTALASSTPYADSFPDANFVYEGIAGGDTTFVYVKRNDDALVHLGYAGNFAEAGFATLHVEPGDTIYSFPIQYGNHSEQSYYFEVTMPSPTPPIDSIRFKSATDKTTDIDAWGTITMPSGTYDCLRSKIFTFEHDSTWALMFGTWTLVSSDTSSNLTYEWNTNEVDPGFTLVSMDYYEGSVSDVTFLIGTPVGIKQNKNSAISVYPNPAVTTTTVKLDRNITGKITVFNDKGQPLMKKDFSGNRTNLDLSGLPSGIYLLSVEGDNGRFRYSGRIIKR